MIEIEAPDGSIVEFPDDTPRDVMRDAMRKRFGGGVSAPAPVPADDAGPLQAAKDIARLTAGGAGFGLAERAASYLKGTSLEEERAKTEEARKRAGWAGTVAETAGMVAPASMLARTGMMATQALPRAAQWAGHAPGIGTRAAGASIDAAALGLADAVGRDQDPVTGAAVGAVAGPIGQVAGEAIAAGAGRVGQAFNFGSKGAPSVDDLAQAKRDAYAYANAQGAVATPEGMQALRQRTEQRLAQEAYDPALQPQVAPVVRRMEDWENNNVTLEGLEVLRKMTRPGLASPERETRAKARIVQEEIDNFINNMENNPRHVLAGQTAQAGEAARAMNEARSLANREFKAQDVETALERARMKAARQFSGGNIDNATRQELDKVLQRRRDWTPDEAAALEHTITGTPRAVRSLAKLSPEGSGLMALGHIGNTGAWANYLGPELGGAVGVGTPIAGFIAKRASDALTRGRAEQLGEIIRAGGSRAAALPAPNMLQRLSEEQREALARALAVGGALQAY